MRINLDNELTLYTYERTTDEDLRLFRAWARMAQDGDLDRLLLPSEHSPGAFMALLRQQVVVLYALDAHGEIYFMSWLAVFMALPTMSMWLRGDKRKSRSSARLISFVYSIAFLHTDVVLGITKQEKLLRIHKHLGYEVMCKIPGLWDKGVDAWVIMLEKRNYRYLIPEIELPKMPKPA